MVITLDGIEKALRIRLKTGKQPTEELIRDIVEYLSIKEKSILEQKKPPLKEINQLNRAKIMADFLGKGDLEEYQLPDKIHPAGMLTKGFVIEPLDTWNYVYNWCGLKGIAKIERNPANIHRFMINIEDNIMDLDGKPISKFMFQLPDKIVVKKWIKDDIKIPTNKELWNKLYNMLSTFMELSPKSLYIIIMLFILESWIYEKFKTVFFLSILGEFGGGKTCLLEILCLLCKHGYLTPNPSTSFVGRVTEGQKLMIGVDEIDSLRGTEDSDLLQMFRTAYRKGATYSRINRNTLEPESFYIYGPKSFTAHSDIEDALQTRSFPIITTEALDKLIPVINYVKEEYANPLFNDIFIWYIDKVINIVDIVDIVNVYRGGRDMEEYDRKKIYGEVVRHITDEQLNLLGKLSGRNAELGLVMVKIINLLKLGEGNQSTAILNDIAIAFKIKKELEEERYDTGDLGLCRDMLADKYKQLKNNANFITMAGEFKIANKDLYDDFNTLLRNKGHRGITPSEFKGFLRDLGFEIGESRKRMKCILEKEMDQVNMEQKSRLCCIFTPKALRKLGLPIEKLGEQEELKDG